MELSSVSENATMDELALLYLHKHAYPKKKASSAKMDQYLIEKHIQPYFTAKLVADVTSRDVCLFQDRYRNTPTTANRLLEVLSKMLTLAECWGFRSGTNPCRHVDRFAEKPKNRFLSAEEIVRLQKELTRQTRTTPHAAGALRLLLLTGCRRSEILNMKWEQVDLTKGVFKMPDSKTGARYVPLNDSAIKVLRKIPRVGDCPYVIANPRTGKGLQDLNRTWRRVRKYTKLEDVRLHDLRHTFASRAVEAGLSLIVISKLLGHKQLQTTQRYAHLAFEDALVASNRVAEFMPRH